MATYRNDTKYVAKRDALKRQARKNSAPCWLCGHSIDYDLDWKHPMSFTADHIEAVANGGSMTGALAPAHRSCNSRRGKRAPTRPLEKPKTTRDW